MLGVVDWTFLLLVPVCVALEAAVPRVGGFRLASAQNARNLVYLLGKAVCSGIASALLAAAYAAARPGWGLAPTPFAVQCAAVFLAIDLKQYLVHRWTHASGWLWRFHKVHHSTPHLNWLAVGRTHLLEYFVLQVLTSAALVWALGADPAAYALASAISLVLGGLGAHVNVDFPRGPLPWWARIVVTPNVHAHHHGLHPRAVNLGESLVVWDHLFGTFEAPPAAPRAFGLVDEPEFPEGMVAQQLSPFRG